jgi:hypothetical protein
MIKYVRLTMIRFILNNMIENIIYDDLFLYSV